MIGILMVFIGGGIGAVTRYLISSGAYRILGDRFPWGTIAVNLIGAFLIGFLWTGFERAVVPSHLRMLIFTGFLGGFTTFSTYALESINLFRDGETLKALMNLGAMNLGGLLFAIGGVMLFYRIFR